jgi:hypothetical protein
MAAKRSRLSEGRKEARELLKRAKSAPVKGGARTKLEKRAGELLRREKLVDLRPDEIRARAKTYAGAFGERLVEKAAKLEREKKDQKNARARELRAEKKAEAERVEKKRAADRERQRRRREKVRELRQPFGVDQEYEGGRGTGELVGKLLDEAKPRPWCKSGPVHLVLNLNSTEYNEAPGSVPAQRVFVLDLARLTSSEGGIVADWIMNSILFFFAELNAEDGPPQEYRRKKVEEEERQRLLDEPQDEDARAEMQQYEGLAELFCEPLKTANA